MFQVSSTITIRIYVLLQRNRDSDEVVASPLVGESIGIVDIDVLADIGLGQGDCHRGTHRRSKEERIGVEQHGGELLITILVGLLLGSDVLKGVTGANHKVSHKAVFHTDSEDISGIGVGGERGGQRQSVLGFITGQAFSGTVLLGHIGIFAAEPQEVVRHADSQQGGHLELGGTDIKSLLHPVLLIRPRNDIPSPL